MKRVNIFGAEYDVRAQVVSIEVIAPMPIST